MSQVPPQPASSDELLHDLTEPQRQAVTHLDGPLLIIAAAGSGKTRVITRRVAYLMSQGIPPPSILAITFTNKAANEMKQRVSSSSPKPLRDWGRLDQPWPIICTFHSLCLRILKHYAVQIGLTPNFSVFDAADQTRLIKEATKSLELSVTNFPASTVHGTISNAKNRLIDAAAFARDNADFYSRNVARIYTKYQKLLAANNALDFDDLLLRAVYALREHPDILAELQERFAYILIDEYQDTNHAQYMLAHVLAQKHRNICAVGDPDQSIYAWRGADLSNILDFEKDYPDVTVVRLEQNYRSTKSILAIADKLISNNHRRKEKRLWTQNADGEKAVVLFCPDEHAEADAVAGQLGNLQRQGIPWSDMAIFYRINALSRVMEDALRRRQIPYQIARGVEFYNRKEIKDVLAYLRAIANPNDEVSLCRIINVPTRGISDATVKHLQAHAIAANVSLWQALGQPADARLSPRAGNAAAQFIRLIESFRASAQHNSSVQALMEEVVKRSGLDDLLRKEDPDAENQLANVNELISSASEYDKENPQGSLDDYLSRVSLVSDADHLDGAGGSVTLMTLHAAKGLEFPVVAIIGMEDGCLPHSRSRDMPEELEEERRLCFVGITRAQQRLILSKAAYRTIRGLRERTAPSQFLAELPKNMLDVQQYTAGQERQGECLGEFRIGQSVRHPGFGMGKIVDLSNSGPNTRAVVEFHNFGRKILVVEHARLSPA